MQEEEPENVRRINIDEVKNIDTNQVAYFTLTDGTVVVVKPETDENKENIEQQKDQIDTAEMQQNQNNLENQQNEKAQQEILKTNKENEQNNTEEINTDNQQINNENIENEENYENAEQFDNEEQKENVNQNYIVQNDNGIIEENYNENFQQPEQVEYIESNVEGGGKMMSYGGIIEERNNYRFYASGIGYIEPENQQFIETQNQNQNDELLQNEEEENYINEQQQICNYCGRPCNEQFCKYCQKSQIENNNYYANYQYNNLKNIQSENYYPNVSTRIGNVQGVIRQDGQLYKVIEAIPVKINEYENLEYEDSNNQNVYENYPQNYKNINQVRYENEEYLPDDEYLIEEVNNNNYYEDDKDNYCTCGDNNNNDDEEYYICEEGPVCNCPRKEEIEELRVVRNVRKPIIRKNYNYYGGYGYNNNVRTRTGRTGRK